MVRLNEKQIRSALRVIINKKFTFADLSPRFKNVDDSSGNIFCPFHDNHHSPAAKMYWDNEREIWIIHCFGQCHRNFTTFDYVDLILCEKYNRYKSPLDFAQQNIPKEELMLQIKEGVKRLSDFSNAVNNFKEDYINKVSEENENTIDYIEALYTA